MNHSEEISNIFKAEYSNLIAVLCRYYGIENMALAEDIISDTFLQAMRTWSHKGVPDQPKAWLRRVAQNKLTDHFRRKKLFDEKIAPSVAESDKADDAQLFSESIIEDSQLNMFFAVCHPDLKTDAQICLALRILCGFGIDEIAVALLSKKDTINKKIYRAKQRLKDQQDSWLQLTTSDYVDRLDRVLKIIYLIFNEGYYSSVADVDVRQELCWEAMRLCLFLSKQDRLPKINIHGLLALMCFHASRFEARVGQSGEYILYEAQNRDLWNHELIKKGTYYLSLSAAGQDVSVYHVEAAIAYWHTTDHPDKWNNILQLYNKLLTMQYSPIAAMNRTYALAKANSTKEAIVEAQKLKLQDHHLYHSLLAELYRMEQRPDEQVLHLKLAQSLANKESEKQLIMRRLEEVKGG